MRRFINEFTYGLPIIAGVNLIICVLSLVGSLLGWINSPQLNSVLFVAAAAGLIIAVQAWFKAIPPGRPDAYNYKAEEDTWITMTIMDQFRRKRD